MTLTTENDSLGRNLGHLVDLVDELHRREVSLKVLKGQVSLCTINATVFCNINVTLHDICTASVCMVSAGLNCLDFGYFFDRAGGSISKLVVAA